MARAGSTWLYEVLKSHPEVYVPPAKDLYFFDRHFDRGMKWYLSFFEDAGNARAIGELSHDYYYSIDAAERIRQSFPEIRIICCLRDPVSWATSVYNYSRSLDESTLVDTAQGDVSFSTFMRQPKFQKMLAYAENLHYYLERFPRENILILFYDDLKEDAAAFARRVFSFLDVDPEYVPPMLEERINPVREPRNPLLVQAAYRGGLLLRKLGMANLVGRIKHHPLFLSTFFKGPSREKYIPTLEEQRYLQQNVERDRKELEAITGRSLPRSWEVGIRKDGNGRE